MDDDINGGMAAQNLQLNEFGAGGGLEHIEGGEDKTATDLSPVFDVPVNISAVLGKAHMSVASLLKLAQGSVLELDRKVGEAIDIYVNNRLVARGEVVIVDERLGVWDRSTAPATSTCTWTSSSSTNLHSASTPAATSPRPT